MLEFFQGVLQAKAPDRVVLDLGAMGVGLRVSRRTFEALPAEGTAVRLLAHLHVMQDGFELYGFADDEERRLFRMLIAIPKVGPSVAMALLSSGKPEEILQWVLAEDQKQLTKVPGIGPAVARRILMELKPRLEKAGVTLIAMSGRGPEPIDDAQLEAVAALEALGFSRTDAYRKVARILAEENDLSLEETIKRALQS